MSRSAEALAGPDGREVVESRLTLNAVSAAMAHLPDEQRMLIALVCIDGLSYKEAAEITAHANRHRDEPAGQGAPGAARTPGGSPTADEPEPATAETGEQHMTLEEMLAEAGITEMEIMRYADGDLAPERRPVVRAALANYPELMQLLESFIFTRDPLADVYDEVLKAPIPEPLLRLLRPPVPPPAPRRGKLGTLIDTVFGSPARTAFALAAMSAVVLAAWLLLSRPVGHDFATLGERGHVASPPLHQVLEKTRQGETVKISKDLSIRPRSTFDTSQGTRCREIDVIFPNRMETAALACRGSDGAWRVPVIPTPPIATYETAGGKQDGKQDKPQQSDPRVDEGSEMLAGAKRQIGAKDVSPEQEKSLIEKGWTE